MTNQPDSQAEHICTGGTWNNTTKQFECKHIPVDSQAEGDFEAAAMNIVFQLADQYVPAGIEGVKLRQSTNDHTIDFVKKLVEDYAERLATRRAVEALKQARDDMRGVSYEHGDKVNGDHSFMRGISTARELLADRIAELTAEEHTDE